MWYAPGAGPSEAGEENIDEGVFTRIFWIHSHKG